MPHNLIFGLPNHVSILFGIIAVIGVAAAAALRFSPIGATVRSMQAPTSTAVCIDRGSIPAILAVGAPAAILAAILFAIKARTPIWDDGAIILTKRIPLTLDSILKPYHEHLHAVPIILWGWLVGLFGSSSGALLALLLLTELLLATGTAALLVARLGRVAGFALALPLAFLGSAHYDLLMPWQIVFTIPLLTGLVAVWLSIPSDRTPLRMLVVALALVAGVISSEVGMFVVFALGVWFLLDARWRQIEELVPAAVVWLIWFVTYGRSGINDDGLSKATIGAVIPYTVAGIMSGLGGLAGLGPPIGGVILILALIWLIARRPRLNPAFVGFALAIVAMFAVGSLFRSYGAVGSLFRSDGTAEGATTSRYIYLVAYFLAFGVAVAAPKISNARRLVPIAVIAVGLNLLALVQALPTYP